MVSDVPPAVTAWCLENGWGEVQFTVSLAGGDVSRALCLEMGSGRPLVLKAKAPIDLVPPQSPALIHGDLWSGNALTGPRGEPALIDPAAHFGWAEAELGMTLLFGGSPGAFYDAYAASYPLAPAGGAA